MGWSSLAGRHRGAAGRSPAVAAAPPVDDKSTASDRRGADGRRPAPAALAGCRRLPADPRRQSPVEAASRRPVAAAALLLVAGRSRADRSLAWAPTVASRSPLRRRRSRAFSRSLPTYWHGAALAVRSPAGRQSLATARRPVAAAALPLAAGLSRDGVPLAAGRQPVVGRSPPGARSLPLAASSPLRPAPSLRPVASRRPGAPRRRRSPVANRSPPVAGCRPACRGEVAAVRLVAPPRGGSPLRRSVAAAEPPVAGRSPSFAKRPRRCASLSPAVAVASPAGRQPGLLGRLPSPVVLRRSLARAP